MGESETDFSPEENLFQYRFPMGGDKGRLNAWRDEYCRWWVDEYHPQVCTADWLENPKKAAKALREWQPQRILSPKMMEAAVCSPKIEVSRLLVEMKALTTREFALALAHPLLSVHDLFDAEIVAEGDLEKYRQAQIRNGVGVVDVDRALEEAREMVRVRKPFVYPPLSE